MRQPESNPRRHHGANSSLKHSFFQVDQTVAPGEKPDANLCAQLLKDQGKALIQLTDAAACGRSIFQELAAELGRPHEHDSQGTTLWDVRYQPNNSASAAVQARSLTMDEFPMHTDGSFEDPAPDYIGLYVVQADREGGGLTRLLDSQSFFDQLSRNTVRWLANSHFPIRVPEEFYKGKTLVHLPILTADGWFRFRDELIVRYGCSSEQLKALDELNSFLEDESLVQSFTLPNQSILLLHNGRYFHGRSAVRDSQRHLLRLRIHGAETAPARAGFASTRESMLVLA